MEKPETLKIQHTVTIEKFSSHLKDIVSVDSVFGDDRHRFFVEIFPNGRDPDTRKKVSIFFWLSNCELNNVVAKYAASILDPAGKERNFLACRNKHTFVRYGFGKGFFEFISQDYLLDPVNNLLQNDTLTLKFIVEIFRDEIGTDNLNTTFFHWPIENFRSKITEPIEENEFIESSIFPLVNNEKYKFLLELYTNGEGEEAKGHLTIRLRFVACDLSDNSPSKKHKISYALSVLDWKGKKRNFWEYPDTELTVTQASTITKFATHEKLLSIMQNGCDTLQLLCQIDPIEDSINVSHNYELSNANITNAVLALGNGSNTIGNLNIEHDISSFKFSNYAAVSAFVLFSVVLYFNKIQ